jgi:hypothetical protein
VIFTADPVTDLLTSAAHGLELGELVYVASAGELPDPLVSGGRYLAEPVSSSTFRLQTLAGDAIDILDAGTGVHSLFPLRDRVDVVDAGRLFELVRDYVLTSSPGVSVVFGWRAPPGQLNQGTTRASRIAIVPGEDNGKAGAYQAPRHGRNRQAYSKRERVTVYCWGADLSDRSDLAQYRAARAVENTALCALRGVMSGRVEPVDPRWVTTPAEMSFGRELVFTLELTVPVLREERAAFVSPLTPTEARVVPEVIVDFGTSEVRVCPHEEEPEVTP